ncbi:LysR family transcriptional regulator [Pokkaliibacter plantistimulans]|uniref:LysR family transcriptional regulator n=1 Tax=Proteobacteria bacterium 228 TaxID=2083153 RepID=A0A2S5KNS0_9PROT|nr:LysR family transcriptional regulator [Pokkaliibacter plantistimulans]PPC76179.1 LysR family transcriptional regulator [Pokkaliibacter plantistimulans]
MEFFQLRCFVTVATELNFSRAAQRLNMTQPPLSRQIQLLEHRLGVQLLTRSTRNVTLTAAGRAFFSEARDLLERAELAALSARRIAEGDIGTIALSFVPSAVYEFLPRVIADTHRLLPEVKISLSEMNSFEQYEAIRARQVDLGIVRSPVQQDDIAFEFLAREPFVLAMPRQHRLADGADVQLSDLHNEAFIMYSHSAYQPFNELLTGLFRTSRVQPQLVQSLGSTLTILALVNTGMGMALVPRSAAAIKFDQVLYKPVELGEGVHSELFLIWRHDNDNPALLRLLADIRQAV